MNTLPKLPASERISVKNGAQAQYAEAEQHLDGALNALTAASCRAGFRKSSEIARIIGNVEAATERLATLEVTQ